MAFTGRALYSTGIFDGVAEDVSDLIGMISPFETPFLDRLGDPGQSAKNVLHEWLEDSLNPNTITTSAALASVTATSSVMVHSQGGTDAVAAYFMVGDIFKANSTGEFLQVTAISGNYLTVTRGFGGTTATSLDTGQDLFFVSSAALEGADVSVDISRPRTRLSNYAQIFKKDVIISGTVQAVTQLGGVSDELDRQKGSRLKEIVRDLEKAVINGKTSGNSIGTASAYRSMKGVWDFISTNSTSIATITPSALNDIVKGAWDQGATDLDVIVCDPTWKKVIDQFNDTNIRVVNPSGNEKYSRKVATYEGTFGTQEVIMSRWMPSKSLMVLSTDRIKVMPLDGRSFAYKAVAQTGDADKGMIIGEYTVEVKNQAGLAKAYG